LGNGASYRELYFLLLGAYVVFTDLSIVAAREAHSTFRQSELWKEYHDQIEFHAVDAMHLPFRNETFDVIYGVKFVGFVPDLARFFFEVHRCLKLGGRCRFSDDAFAPAWEATKATLKKVSHPLYRRNPRSRLQQVRSAASLVFTKERSNRGRTDSDFGIMSSSESFSF
jgi:SAM-dependent methyltransferase